MGKKWGELAKIRHVIQFRISPYEQNIWAGTLSKGIPNLYRRIRSQFFQVVPRKYYSNLYELYKFLKVFSGGKRALSL